MTAKTPDSPQESRPPTAPSLTSSVPAQPAEPATGTGAVVSPAAPAQAAPATAATSSGKAATSGKAGKPAASGKAPAKKPPVRTTRESRLGGVAFVTSVLAVLIAIGSTLVSIYTLDVARKAKSRTADIATAQTAKPTAPVSSSAEPSPSATTPRIQFAPEIVRTDLRIPPADGCASVFVDVDSMQVGVDNGHEFYLSNCLGSLALRIDRTSGAVPTQGNPTPDVCVAQLAGSSPNELVLEARVGLTFCLLTNKAEAARQGMPQRVGIVEVRDVGADKSVTVTISTYRVPE